MSTIATSPQEAIHDRYLASHRGKEPFEEPLMDKILDYEDIFYKHFDPDAAGNAPRLTEHEKGIYVREVKLARNDLDRAFDEIEARIDYIDPDVDPAPFVDDADRFEDDSPVLACIDNNVADAMSVRYKDVIVKEIGEVDEYIENYMRDNYGIDFANLDVDGHETVNAIDVNALAGKCFNGYIEFYDEEMASMKEEALRNVNDSLGSIVVDDDEFSKDVGLPNY